MKMLMITPEVDKRAPILGFIVSWINRLASKVDRLHVVTLVYDSETELPENVTVYNLGDKKIKFTKYLYFSRIMLSLLRKRQNHHFDCHGRNVHNRRTISG